MAHAATGTVRAIKRDSSFAWEGKDKRGARVKGKSLAPDEQTLRAELRRQGVAPSRIRKQRQGQAGGRVKAGDIAIFARQLSTMLAAGIPLVQAFEIVGNGNDKAAMQRLILDVKADVEGGTSLHESLAKHPLHFDDLFVNLVEAGEHAGALESLLDKVATARYARTLSTMFSAGVPLVEALESVAGATGNIVYENAVLKMRDEVSTGQRLQRSMENTGLFPNMVNQMIAVGEESGSLDEMSAKVATFYEAEVDNAVDAMSSLLEPMIMVILGVLVGSLVIAMYLPIFKLGSVV